MEPRGIKKSRPDPITAGVPAPNLYVDAFVGGHEELKSIGYIFNEVALRFEFSDNRIMKSRVFISKFYELANLAMQLIPPSAIFSRRGS